MSALRIPAMNWKQRLVAVLGLAGLLVIGYNIARHADFDFWFVFQAAWRLSLWYFIVEWLWRWAKKPPKGPARPLSTYRGGLPSRQDDTNAWRLRNAEAEDAVQVTPGDQTGQAETTPR